MELSIATSTFTVSRASKFAVSLVASVPSLGHSLTDDLQTCQFPLLMSARYALFFSGGCYYPSLDDTNAEHLLNNACSRREGGYDHSQRARDRRSVDSQAAQNRIIDLRLVLRPMTAPDFGSVARFLGHLHF